MNDGPKVINDDQSHTPNTVGRFDIFDSSQESKSQGYQMFLLRHSELASFDAPTTQLLFPGFRFNSTNTINLIHWF